MKPMTPDDVQRTISKIVPIILDELDSYGFGQHCIEAASLLTRSLHGAGMPSAYPLTVGVRLLNEACQHYVDAHGPPQDDAGRKACNDAGGAIVVLGKDAPEVPEGRWAGHLVKHTEKNTPCSI